MDEFLSHIAKCGGCSLYEYVDLLPETSRRSERLKKAFCSIGERLFYKALRSKLEKEHGSCDCHG
jgi:hypothetical protein